jgi:hypothetical protein
MTTTTKASIGVAHGDINAASSILQYIIKAERERGNTDLADTLVAADEQFEHALESLDGALKSAGTESQP